jgi:hypothetical protein
MKERPIIFSGEMVRAILEGRKTQTRRVISKAINADYLGMKDGTYQWLPLDKNGHYISCPYGKPGDQLWVRETFAVMSDGEKTGVCYRIDGEEQIDREQGERWTSPRFMPRWASRIMLVVMDIRAEMVRKISEDDAMQEGLWDGNTSTGPNDWHRQQFHRLWDSINAKRGYGWEVNPWVWVIEFGRIS